MNMMVKAYERTPHTCVYILNFSNELTNVYYNYDYYLLVLPAEEPDIEPAASLDSGKLLDGTFSSPCLTDSPFTSGSQSTNILDISFTKTSCSSTAETADEKSQEYQQGKK